MKVVKVIASLFFRMIEMIYRHTDNHGNGNGNDGTDHKEVKVDDVVEKDVKDKDTTNMPKSDKKATIDVDVDL